MTIRDQWKNRWIQSKLRQFFCRPRQTFFPIFNASTSALQSQKPIASADLGIDQSLIKQLCRQGRLKEALHTLQAMDRRGIPPDGYTYASLLQTCVNIKFIAACKLVHAHIILTGFEPDISSETKLVTMYAKCGKLADARRALEGMAERDVISWTAMISAYSQHGRDEKALELFYQMQNTGVRPDNFTFATVLTACAQMGALEQGKEVHGSIVRNEFLSDVFVGSALVDMYVKCASIEDASKLFDKMPNRNLVSWNVMIAGCEQNGREEEALELFCKMKRMGFEPDKFTFPSVLSACASLEYLEKGREVHEDIIRKGIHSDVFVGSALLDMYVKCGNIEDADRVLDRMPERNIVSWNVMIAGYAQNGRVGEALSLFRQMPEQSVVSWTVMTAGYARNGHVGEALDLFQKMPERNLVSWNAMIAGYAQSGFVNEAMDLFEKMPERNVVSWNAMIAAYAQNGCFHETLNLFQQMQRSGVRPDQVTFASVLPACANLSVLGRGKKVHKEIIHSGFESDIFVGNALADMYAKCGSVEDAHKMFFTMPLKNVVSWTTIIVGYAMNGFGKESLQLFEEMKLSGMKPNHITFVGVLSACCHSGLVDDGWRYFICMSKDYHIAPGMEHYCCMVDLLGRAGCLDDAYSFINKMPIKPDTVVWGSLLAACRIHTNIELGQKVAEQLFDLDPENAAHFVMLSNIYAAAGRWDDAQNVRKMIDDKKLKKTPGCSWIELNHSIYTFLTGDRSHPETDNIYAKLESLSGQMKDAGYLPDMDYVLHDVEEQQKEQILGHHSEKLAIAFGLINMSPGTTIRIVKNLRVCGDCHSAIKFFSKMEAREIVVRDTKRFHHFKDGQCSCGDYW